MNTRYKVPLPSLNKNTVIQGTNLPIEHNETKSFTSTNDTTQNELLKGKYSCYDCLDIDEIRIFLSSTFTDFRLERNNFIQHCLPELNAYCTQFGLSLCVSDMRWGMSDMVKNEHLVEELCLKEINRCKQLSVGPFFIGLIGNRYGYQPIPPTIKLEEFDILLNLIRKSSQTKADFMIQWYKLDSNSLPPIYRLQPIRSAVASYGDYSDEAARRVAGNEWWEIEEKLRYSLRIAASEAEALGQISATARHNYYRSVTEAEIVTAISNVDEKKKKLCLLYFRELVGINDHLDDEEVPRFTDIVYRNEKAVLNSDCSELKRNLKSNINRLGISAKTFRVAWQDGIHLRYDSHKKYLNDLRTNMIKDIKEKIKESVDARKYNVFRKDALLYEIALHSNFGFLKCSNFYGRHSELSTLRKLLLERDNGEGSATVLYGIPGVGKTAMIAQIARNFSGFFDGHEDCVCVLRFIGTSHKSSSLRDLLHSMCDQISRVYNIKVDLKRVSTANRLQEIFSNLLKSVSLKAAGRSNLLIALDSLDQMIDLMEPLSPKRIRPIIDALLPVMPSGIFFLFSVASQRHDLMEELRAKVTDSRRFVELDALQLADVPVILEQIFEEKSRQLSREQWTYLMSKVETTCTPLFLRLALSQALSWCSYTPLEQCCLQDTVEKGIHFIFEKVEQRYGQLFVARAFAFLTCGLHGLSELELEDALSCEDDVLNEIFHYHDPPVKGVVRVPALLLSRVISDIEEYVSYRTVDGRQTLYWYHSQFARAAESRYVFSECHQVESLHASLAVFFAQEQPLHRTICLRNSKRVLTVSDADRAISWSSLEACNKRKLSCMLYHARNMKQYDVLLRNCLCRVKFLAVYIEAFGMTECVHVLKQCLTNLQHSELLLQAKCVHDCLMHFQHKLLIDNIESLAVQLLGQLDDHCSQVMGSTALRMLVQECHKTLDRRGGMALRPMIACFPSCLGVQKSIIECVQNVWFNEDWEKNFILAYVHRQTDRRVRHQVRVVDTNDNQLICSFDLKEPPLKCCISSDDATLYVLDWRNIHLFDVSTKKLLCSHSVNINNKVLLNKTFGVTPNAQQIALVGDNRIAILHDISHSKTGQRSLSHKGLFVAKEHKSTSAILFSHKLGHRLIFSLHENEDQQTYNATIVGWHFDMQKAMWSIKIKPDNEIAKCSGQLLSHPTNETCFFLALSSLELIIVDVVMGHVLNRVNFLSCCPSISNQDKLYHKSWNCDRQNMNISVNFECKGRFHFVSCFVNDVSVPRLENCSFVKRSSALSAVRLAESGHICCAMDDNRINVYAGDTAEHDTTVCMPLETLTGHTGRIGMLMYNAGSTFLYSHGSDFVLRTWELSDTTRIQAPKLSAAPRQLPFVRCRVATLFKSREEFIALTDDGLYRVNFEKATDYHLICAASPSWHGCRRGVLCNSSTRTDGFLLLELGNGNLALLETDSGHELAQIKRPLAWQLHNDAKRIWLLNKESTVGSRTSSSSVADKGFLVLQLVSPPSMTIEGSCRFLPPILISLESLKALIITSCGNFALTWYHSAEHDNSGSIVQLWCIDLREAMTSGGQGVTVASYPCRAEDQPNGVGAGGASSLGIGANAIKRGGGAGGSSRLMATADHHLPVSTVISCGAGKLILGELGEIPILDMSNGSASLLKVQHYRSFMRHSRCVSQVARLAESNAFTRQAITALAVWSRVSIAKKNTKYSANEAADIVLSGCRAGHVVFWNMAMARDWSGTAIEMETDVYRLSFVHAAVHSSEVTALAFSSCGQLAVSGGADKSVCLYRVADGAMAHRLMVHVEPTALHFGQTLRTNIVRQNFETLDANEKEKGEDDEDDDDASQWAIFWRRGVPLLVCSAERCLILEATGPDVWQLHNKEEDEEIHDAT